MTVRLVDIPDGAIEQRDEWIPLADGTRLHARLWLPAGTPDRPVPALLEYLPYRLDDWTSVRDSERHPYYALHGYASVRVDIRGTGSSEGVFDDEYSETELSDGEAVIAWIAEQPWCTGKVGMFGISWGGFNSLQLAARRPPALAAIVTCCSSADRYGNDVHYLGGAVLGVDMAAWAATMFAFTARPPRPEITGDTWVKAWLQRLDSLEPLAPVWLSHQERDDYWRRGSVCEDYGAIDVAVLAVGGWADPYHDTVFQILDGVDAPRKGLLGPWPHQYPDRETAPGPVIGFLQETLRWWDRWLRDIDTGVDDDPDLRVWLGESHPPAPYVAIAPGTWRSVEAWPPPTQELREYPLAGPVGTVTVSSPRSTGSDAGRYFPMGNSHDLPPDQQQEDARGVTFDLEPGEVDILGFPEVRLRLRSTAPRANVIVRLCDVAPDGSSLLLTRGVLNLARRNGMDRNDDLIPGRWEDVVVRPLSLGHHLAPGHRLRVALSNHYWPWVWPHEMDGALEVDPAASTLRLPIAPAGGPATFAPAEHARPLPAPNPDPEGRPPAREVTVDPATGTTTVSFDPDYGGSRDFPDGLTWREETLERYVVIDDDPLSPMAQSRWEICMEAPDWGARISTRSQVSTAPGEFVVENVVHARARDSADGPLDTVIERRYVHRVPRTSA